MTDWLVKEELREMMHKNI